MTADASLRQIYERERNKRVTARTVGKAVDSRNNETVAEITKDPWVDYDAVAQQDPPLKDGDSVKFLILGAGHSGILMAYHLIAAGFSPSEIVVVDEAGGFGGTWYYNRYPGLTCDIEGYCYLPLLEETGYVPKHRYSKGEEIRQHAERVAEKFNIRGLFCTRVLGATWVEEKRHWAVQLQRDLGPNHQELCTELSVRAQFFLVAPGVFLSPAAPDLPGLGKFRANRTLFHSSRWDYHYTGGTPSRPDMHKLKDKVVGIIGTGATGVQIAPELAKHSKHVYVFQRTPSYCGPRLQVETTPQLWASVAAKTGWQRDRVRNLNSSLHDDPEATPENDLIKDGWSFHRTWSALNGSVRAKDLSRDSVEQHVQRLLDLDTTRATVLREHVGHEVENPETAEKLKAWYPGWCKRPTFHQEYLPAFNQPNVTLVDTDGQGVQSYTERGVVIGDGHGVKEYELDALVLATGFTTQSQGSPDHAAGISIRGRGGRELQDKWKADDYGNLFGVATHEFPNLFFLSPHGSSASANLTSCYDITTKLIAHIIKAGFQRSSPQDGLVLEVCKADEDKYCEEIVKMGHWFAGLATCTPGYFTGYRAKPDKIDNPKQTPWPGGIIDYERMVDEWIEDGRLEGIEITT